MSAAPKRSNRLLAIMMAAVVAIAAVMAIVLWRGVERDPDQQGAAAIGGPFSLIDQNGDRVTDQSYKGSYRLIYFGYTFCPDACPTELQVMAQAIDDLGPDGRKVTPIFITIDPARDTPKQLAGYVPLFGERLVGLTGSPAEIAQVAREYKVYYAKADQPGGGDYAMNHSSFVYLMDPEGRFLTVFSSDMDGKKMAAGIRGAMKG